MDYFNSQRRKQQKSVVIGMNSIFLRFESVEFLGKNYCRLQ